MNALEKSLQRVIAARHRAVELEDRFLRDLSKLASIAPRTSANGQPRAERRVLKCPRCERRFARPLHLGRHLSATHQRKRRRAA